MNHTSKDMKVELLSDTVVEISRFLEAPQALAFEVWTECRHLQKWLTGAPGWSMPICQMDLRPGGKYRWGWDMGEGHTMEITGTFKEVSRPDRVVSTESWGGDWPETLNTMTFVPRDGGTLFAITIEYPSKAARDSAMETGMKDGMEAGFANFDKYVATLD
jgi:uncharacterized protein YndB with AHSA1/START domain